MHPLESLVKERRGVRKLQFQPQVRVPCNFSRFLDNCFTAIKNTVMAPVREVTFNHTAAMDERIVNGCIFCKSDGRGKRGGMHARRKGQCIKMMLGQQGSTEVHHFFLIRNVMFAAIGF